MFGERKYDYNAKLEADLLLILLLLGVTSIAIIALLIQKKKLCFIVLIADAIISCIEVSLIIAMLQESQSFHGILHSYWRHCTMYIIYYYVGYNFKPKLKSRKQNTGLLKYCCVQFAEKGCTLTQ